MCWAHVVRQLDKRLASMPKEVAARLRSDVQMLQYARSRVEFEQGEKRIQKDSFGLNCNITRKNRPILCQKRVLSVASLFCGKFATISKRFFLHQIHHPSQKKVLSVSNARPVSKAVYNGRKNGLIRLFENFLKMTDFWIPLICCGSVIFYCAF